MDNKSSHYLKLAGIILAATLVVSLIVLIIGWVNRWNEPAQFSNAFFIAGALLTGLGVLSVSGGFAQRGNFNLTYAESAGQDNISQRTQRMMGEINQRYGTMTLLGITGILLMVISVVIA
jgi:hypothetical protein